MNADRRVEVFAVAGAFTRVIADAAVHGRHRIVANEHLPGVAILPSLRQGKPGLDVLAGRTRVIAGRQQVDVNRAPGSNRACPLLPGQIHDWRHVVWFVPHVRLLRASALVRLAAARQGRYDVVAAEDLIWVNADHFRFAPGSGSHGTGSSNPVPSSRESRANLTSSIRAPKLRSATACSLASLRRSVRHADFAGAKRASNFLEEVSAPGRRSRSLAVLCIHLEPRACLLLEGDQGFEFPPPKANHVAAGQFDWASLSLQSPGNKDPAEPPPDATGQRIKISRLSLERGLIGSPRLHAK